MLCLFNKTHSLPLVLPADAGEAVILAAADLQRDLRCLSGQPDGFAIARGRAGQKAIRIQTLFGQGPEEGYTVTVSREGVLVTGYDMLGTVYGIYAVSTRLLGVLPVHRMTDLFPPRRETLELQEESFASGRRQVRFRGWFLNDEDLLTEFKERTGQRDMDYPFYGDVMNLQVLDAVLETALRLEINLMIPSSFVDILNPAEEELVKAVYRRGLYITQHHIEPMGVSWFGAENYLKRRGIGGEQVSFVANRSRMEEIWRCYAQKWACYGDRVIWQLGLRGKTDRAVWRWDKNVPMDAASRGAIITDAIATQHRIIAETLGTEDFLSTATLWMEGAQLYGEGHLKMPEETMVIFSDIGFSQMLGDDFYTTPRLPGKQYGIYYHVGFHGTGPHLAEGCDLWKMAFSYREAMGLQSCSYVIVNVSNVRPLHLAAWISSLFLNDPAGIDADAALERVLKQLYGEEFLPEALEAYRAYYGAFRDMGKEKLKASCEQVDFYYHEYGPLPFPAYAVTDGVLRSVPLIESASEAVWEDAEHWMAVLEASRDRFAEVYRRLLALEPRVPEGAKVYFHRFIRQQTFYLLQLASWSIGFSRLLLDTAEDRAATVREAVGHLDTILEDRKCLEQGWWQGWHRGEKKIGLEDLRRRTLEQEKG